jgi:hypothetical protein
VNLTTRSSSLATFTDGSTLFISVDSMFWILLLEVPVDQLEREVNQCQPHELPE